MLLYNFVVIDNYFDLTMIARRWGQNNVVLRAEGKFLAALGLAVNCLDAIMTAQILPFLTTLLVAMTIPATIGNAQDTTVMWKGTLDAGGRKLRLEIEIAGSSGTYSGELRSLDQNSTRLKAAEILLDDATFSFTIPQIGAAFEGKLKDGGGLAEGTFTQGGATLPLILTRVGGSGQRQGRPALASKKSLTKLDRLIKGFVKDEQIVGAELLVVQDGKTLLHNAYGWRDREKKVQMTTGSVFCVRSMTKPLIGTSILMLVREGKIKLTDRVSTYLPSFDVDGTRSITVQQLLTHTSGLPMSLLVGKDLKTLDGIRAVAKLGGGHQLEFKPGEDFKYSDQGTDTLTALVEVVSGTSAADFVTQRILKPLNMQDTACVLTPSHALRTRAVSKYAGSPGHWNQFWDPAKPALFPFFLGSQGLYSTVNDYARFMDLWRNAGQADGSVLLDSELVRKALTPTPHASLGSTGLPGMQSGYGYLMQLWTSQDGGQLRAFGHTGSDGTHAWVFPEHNAMVMYFTQSRGTLTGLQVEGALGEVFFGVPFDASRPISPPIEQYLGYYWEGENDLYRAIVRDGDDMALEIVGKAIVPLDFVGKDKWKLRPNPGVILEFDRSEDGEVTGYHIGDHQEIRFTPSEKLPATDKLAARVAKVHRLDLLESIGPVRMIGTLAIEKLKIQGDTSTVLEWPNRYREQSRLAGQSERVAFDGKRVWYASKSKARAEIKGRRAEQLILASPLARFGDWRKSYPKLQVIQKLKRGANEVYLVRAGDTSATAPTLYVDAKSGRVFSEGRVVDAEMMGRVGQKTTFSDFRDVSGMLLPFRTKVELGNPLVGPIVTEVTDVKVGVKLSVGTFSLKD